MSSTKGTTEAGAGVMAGRIISFWAAQGFEVRAWSVREEPIASNPRRSFTVRTDLSNGWPPGHPKGRAKKNPSPRRFVPLKDIGRKIS
jgi:hypothetical protein